MYDVCLTLTDYMCHHHLCGQGMVLCAVSGDHSVIRLLEAPEGAQAGDRVTFPGFPADSVPATPAQMVKKKILEGLAPGVSSWYLAVILRRTYMYIFSA